MKYVKHYQSDLHCPGAIRAENVARDINRERNDYRIDCKMNIPISDFYGTDLMVFQRQVAPENFAKMEAAQRQGIKCIYDLDDDVLNIPPDFTEPYNFYAKPEVRGQVETFLRTADAVTVSTTPLALSLKETVGDQKPVFVVPNFIDIDKWETAYAIKQTERAEHITLGWMASKSHKIDVSVVGPALERIMAEYKNVHLSLIGWVDMDDMPWTKQYNGRVRTSEWVDISMLPLAMKDFDIGLAPLADNQFNRCKCLVRDTLVVTSGGVAAIGSLCDQDHISQGREFKRVSSVARYEKQPTIYLRTARGYHVEGTHNHRVMSGGDYKRLDELNIGDDVDLSFFEYPNKSEVELSGPLFVTKKLDAINLDQLDVELAPRIKITPRWGRFIGYVVGDGCLSSNAVMITFAKTATDIRDDILDFATRIGVTCTPVPRKNSNSTGFSLNSRSLIWFMRTQLKMHKNGRKNLRVPDVIMRSPKPVVAEFLRGLFETDGTITSCGCSFTSMSRGLVEDVQFLMLGFGILSNIQVRPNGKYRKDYYQLALGRQASDIFNRDIGFVSRGKRGRLLDVVTKSHSNAYKPWGLKDSIVSVEHGTADVYDACVPEDHFYVANGLVSHNSNLKWLSLGALGVPCVASPLPPYESIRSGHDGLVVDSNDSDGWYKALDGLLADKNKREIMGAEARRTVLAEWDMRKHSSQWIDVFNKILGE